MTEESIRRPKGRRGSTGDTEQPEHKRKGFSLGKRMGSSEPVGMPPERCGRLELAYREGGWYSGIKYYFPTPVPFEEIQIRVFSPDFHGVVVRLIDQSSQTHQLFLPFKSGEGWQTVTVRRPKWSYHFWAGANDGKWHGGIVGIQLLAEGIRLNDRKARRGFLYFNRISVITPQNGNDVK